MGAGREGSGVRRNVGDVDSFLRITFGVMMVALGIARIVRRDGLIGRLMVLFGAMRLAEGITRFCPTLWLLGISTAARESAGGAEPLTRRPMHPERLVSRPARLRARPRMCYPD